jgi:hypothetical protein
MCWNCNTIAALFRSDFCHFSPASNVAKEALNVPLDKGLL